MAHGNIHLWKKPSSTEKKRRKKSLAEKIKVVHLITLLELGGAQGNTIYTVEHLDTNIFDAYLWCGKGAYWDKRVNRTLHPKGKLRYFSFLDRPLNPIYDLIALLQLWVALMKERPKIIHTHSSKSGILGRIAAKMAGIDIIIHTFHGFGFNDRQNFFLRWLYISLEKLTARFSTALIFVSKSNWKTAQELNIGNDARYRLIRSGIHIRQFSSSFTEIMKKEIRTRFLIPPEVPIVTTVGAFKPQKNLLAFIELAKKIHDGAPDIHFLVVGDGATRPQLETAISNHELKSTVHLLGWREDLPEIMAISTVFVLTSLWEGLPRALVEACMSGVPSVCFDTDGVRDILSQGGGFLIPQGDLQTLAVKVEELLFNPEIRQKKSIEAKSLIGKEFDIDSMVKQQEILYQTLLNQ